MFKATGLRYRCSFPSFYKCRNWGLGRLNNLPRSSMASKWQNKDLNLGLSERRTKLLTILVPFPWGSREPLLTQLLAAAAGSSGRASAGSAYRLPFPNWTTLTQAIPATSAWSCLGIVVRGWVSLKASKDALSKHLPEWLTYTAAGVLKLLLNGNLCLPSCAHETGLNESCCDSRVLVYETSFVSAMGHCLLIPVVRSSCRKGGRTVSPSLQQQWRPLLAPRCCHCGHHQAYLIVNKSRILICLLWYQLYGT